MARTIGYRWHLRRLMADKDMYATTQLRPLLAERGVVLSREQVYRLVTGVPERLSLATLAALCDILGCGPGDLVEPVAGDGAGGRAAAGRRGSGPLPRPVRARVTGAGPRVAAVAARCPAGHELAWPLRRPGVPALPPGARWSRRSSAADPSLPGAVIEAAVDAVAPGGQALRQLADALAADPAALTRRGAAGRRAAGRRADRPRLSRPGHPGVRGLRAGRQAAVPRRRRRGVPAVPRLAAGPALRQLRQGQARRPGSTSTARAVCEVCRRRDDPRRHRECGTCGKTAPVAVRGRGRPAGHLRELLPAARGHLQQMRAAAPVRLRGDQPAGLPLVRAAGHRRLRALRARPAAGKPAGPRDRSATRVTRGPAAPGAVRALRAAAAAGRPARPGR